MITPRDAMSLAPSHLAMAYRQSAARTACLVSICVFAVALFFAARRVAGEMTRPLPAWPLAAVAGVLLLWVWGATPLLQSLPERLPASVRRALAHAPFASLVLFAFACSFPAARFIDWLIWVPAFAAAHWGAHQFPPAAAAELLSARRALARPAAVDDPGQVLQEFTRYRAADGSETFRGTVTAEFAPGERIATIHVAFCPPFARVPRVEAQLADDSFATIQLTQALHQGAQLEVRLPRPAADPARVRVELFAVDPAPPE